MTSLVHSAMPRAAHGPYPRRWSARVRSPETGSASREPVIPPAARSAGQAYSQVSRLCPVLEPHRASPGHAPGHGGPRHIPASTATGLSAATSTRLSGPDDLPDVLDRIHRQPGAH
jgi:hypothetical protein